MRLVQSCDDQTMEDTDDLAITTATILKSQLRITGNFAGLAIKFSSDGSHILKAATLEAALTRFRLLIDFVASRPRKMAAERKLRHPGDLQPSDLGVHDWTPNLPRSIDWDLFDIDKYVVHLTKDRLDSFQGRYWNPGSTLTSILELYDQLASEVDRAGNVDAGQLIRDGIRDSGDLFNAPTIDWPLVI